MRSTLPSTLIEVMGKDCFTQVGETGLPGKWNLGQLYDFHVCSTFESHSCRRYILTLCVCAKRYGSRSWVHTSVSITTLIATHLVTSPKCGVKSSLCWFIYSPVLPSICSNTIAALHALWWPVNGLEAETVIAFFRWRMLCMQQLLYVKAMSLRHRNACCTQLRDT